MVDVHTELNQQPQDLCASTERLKIQDEVAKFLDTETWAKYGRKSEHERFEHAVILNGIPSTTVLYVLLGSANHQSTYHPFWRKFEIHAYNHLQAQSDGKHKVQYLCSSHHMLMSVQQLTNTLHVSLLGRYQQCSAAIGSLYTQRSSKRTPVRTPETAIVARGDSC